MTQTIVEYFASKKAKTWSYCDAPPNSTTFYQGTIQSFLGMALSPFTMIFSPSKMGKHRTCLLKKQDDQDQV